MGIVLKVIHADKSAGTIELGSDSKVVFKPGDRVDVSNIKDLKDVEVDKDGNVILTFPTGKVVLSNLPKEQLDALMAQLPPDEVATASIPASAKEMTGLLLLSLQSMLKASGGLEFNASQSFSGNAVKLDFGTPQTSSDTKTSPFASLAQSGISISASFVSVINGKEDAAAVEDTVTAINASLTVANPVLKDVTFVELSAIKGEYGTFSITKGGNWTYQLNNGAQKVQALSAGENVVDTFTVVSSDGSAASDVRIIITGTNDAPTLAAGGISTTENTASASLDLATLASDIDSDDDPSTLRYSIIDQPDRGSATINGTTLVFAPGSDFASLNAVQSATETVRVRVTDSHGATADNVVVVRVAGTNDAPVLRDFQFHVDEDASMRTPLSALMVSSGSPVSALDYVITSQPALGTAEIVNGTLVFTPGAAAQGLEFGEIERVEVGLRATNSSGLSADTTVRYTVTGAPDKPLPNSITLTVSEDGGPVSIDLVSIVSDRSHDPSLFFWTDLSPARGTLTLSRDGMLTFDPGPFFNELNAGQTSTFSGTVTIDDSVAGLISLPVNIVVNGANEVPVVIDGHLDAVENGSTVAMKLMSLVKTTGLDDGVAPTFAIAQQPEKGLATFSNGQLVFNPAKGFDDLAKGESRDVDVTVRVTNSQGESADATVTVTVTGTNDAPTVSGKTLVITQNATASIDLTTLAADVDSDDSPDTLKYAITGEPQLGNATIKGTVLSFEAGDDFERLAKGESRTVEIDLSATDSHGATDKGTVKITVTGQNDAPTLSAARMSATEDGSSVTLDLAKLAADVDSDDDGNTLTYSIVKGPVEGSARLSGTSLVFDPGQGFQSLEEGETRDVTVTVRATDSHGASADAVITVTVMGLHDGETALLSQIAAGDGGFRIVGEAVGDMAGLSIASAGDFNGDGFDDFIIGAPGNDAIGTNQGAIYLVYGSAERPSSIDLDAIGRGVGGFKISGESVGVDRLNIRDTQDQFGVSVSAAGDINGDGFADIVVGAPGYDRFTSLGNGQGFHQDPNTGAAYVIFGQAAAPASVSLDDIADGRGGFKIEGETSPGLPIIFNVAGAEVAAAGDVNGDGFGDLLIGSQNGAYLVLGGPAGTSVSTLDEIAQGTGGMKFKLPDIYGLESFASGGVSVSALGDVDKDGFSDFAFGSNGGLARIVYGSATLGTSGSAATSVVIAESTADTITIDDKLPLTFGTLMTLSSLGDVNGDGIDDFMVGVPSNAEGGERAGAAYVVFGREGVRGNISLSDIANGIGGFKITGEAAGNAAAISVASAGDLNGDGFTDLVIGASGDQGEGIDQLGAHLVDAADAQAGSGAGSAYVVYGKAQALGEIDLDTIARGIGGFKLTGEASGDHAGISVASAGDIDGDGFDDLLVGASLNDAGGADAGAAYVIYGGFALPNDGDHAHIAGDLEGDIVGARIETATGKLTATFADGRSEGFVAATLQGTYGSFTLLEDGSWTYRLDPDNADVKGLPLGKSLVESFKVKAQDGSAVNVVAIDITSAPSVTGDLTASLIEDYRLTGSGVIGLQGGATARFVPLTQVQGTYGTFDLASDGQWHYQLDPFSEAVQALLPGDDATDSFAVATTDGVGLGTVTVHIDGTFDFTAFGGDRAATIGEDAPGVSGVVKAVDLFAGALGYRPTAVQGQFGTFHLDANGAWTYDLDNDNPTVRALATGAALTEQFVVSEAEDRFTQRVSIRIEGVNDAPVVTAINAGAVSEDDAVVTIDLLAGQTDEETAELSAVSIVVRDNLGRAVAFVDNGDGTVSIDPAQFDALRNGESRTVTVSYGVSDGSVSTPNTATLIINGFADQTAPLANDDTLVPDSQVGEFLVNSATASDQFSPAVTGLSHGGFVVTWISHDYPGSYPYFSSIKAQVFDAGGVAVGAEFLVNGQTNTYREVPAVTALSNGGFVVTWQNDESVFNRSATEIRAQVFAADGSAVGGEFLVNSQTNDTQQAPDITALAGGGFVVTWHSYDGVEDQSGFGVKAQIFDAGGTPVGAEFLVNTRSDSNQDSPAITALSNGGFVITWESYDGIDDTSDYEIRAQIFDANGTPVGTEHLVNTRTANGQYEPDVTALADGGFVIAWESRDRVDDTAGSGIKARLFDASGTAAGDEFLVNTNTEDSQLQPAIAALADGGFVITWRGLDGSASGIKGKVYDAEGNEAGGELSAGAVHTITVESLLGNDTDADGDLLTITAVSSTSALGAAIVLNGDGTISIDPRSVAALQALAPGDRLADTFTYTVSDGRGGTDTATVSLTYRGVNDAPSVVTIDAGSVSEDDGVTTINLLAGQTDAENSALSVLNITAQDDTGRAVTFIDLGNGTISIDPAQFNDLGDYLSREVTISYTVSDGASGTANSATIVVQGVNDAADIAGVTTGIVTEDGVAEASGLLTVADADAGQARFTPVSETDGAYGRFSMDAAGQWTYRLDNANSQVQALSQGQKLTETFAVQSADGTLADVTITINGSDDADGSLPGAPSQILLSSVAASGAGLKIVGGAMYDGAGYGVSSAGDFNGDGFDDLLVSAVRDNQADGGSKDAAYIIFGGTTLAGAINLADVGGTVAGIRIASEGGIQEEGSTVAALGDVNGDGLDDIVLGAGRDGSAAYAAGAAYVIYGTTQAPQTIFLDDIAGGLGGFKITGEAEYDAAGASVASAGDVNKDGYADILIGAPNNSSAGDYAGAAYVIYGSADRTTSVSLQTLALGTEGFKVVGEMSYQLAGASVSSAGDVNQDGYVDLLIGAYGGYEDGFYRGAAYLIYGSGNGYSTIDLDNLGMGMVGYKIPGAAEFDEAGFAVAAAGDINGDGLADMLVGAPFDAPYYGMVEGAMAGKAYVIYGRGDVPYGIDLASMTMGTDSGTSSVGLRIIGENDFDRSGTSVASAGDINGDGLADFIIGAPRNGEGGGDAGAAYVVFGQTKRTGDIYLSDIAAGRGGFKLVGEAAGDAAGSSVMAAGDVNGDGFDDLVVGARANDVTEGDDTGAAYLIFGGAYLGSQDYRGTAADDTIAIANADFLRVDGKSGFDTLLVEGTNVELDFTRLAQDRVSSIEAIDMNGQGNNILRLTAEDVFDMSQAIAGDTTTLVVRLDSGDTLDLSGDGWMSAGTRVEGGIIYDLFTNSAPGPYNVAVLVDRFDYHVY